MDYQQILCEQDGPVMVITLNRPDKLNAFTGVMGMEIADAFQRADADDSVRAVVMTGAGRAFCAGADVSAGAKSFDTTDPHGAGNFGQRLANGGRASGVSFVHAIFNCRKPSIAAINGGCVGVGATMTLPMDVRICSSNAKIGFIFARRGLVPEAGSAWFLPQIVGLPQALRWSITGATFGAEEALRGGLVAEVTAPEDLLARAKAIAIEMTAESSPVSVALTRQLLWRYAAQPDPFHLLSIDGPMSMERGAHADVREGVQAFLDKRKPAFPGKVSRDMPSQYPWWEQGEP
ncbi:enoyl-CoA hydratase-related protein [Camelimonas lactis]|uniref:Enoyl-CoA hydratase/carnithine racemase n=1 Tax=Camelimonas lactis TaxID=659006 RepID=A0A4R2GRI2_9HYPH|nr:enoyl-CoA hydratase-related protein [Camelimonas lactis]TCO11783.1 enoyl-CoA hydratase/carnithine racemase [Camelimonas lactis]